MAKKPAVTAKQAAAWYSELNTRHPQTCGDGYEVASAACTATEDGVHFRLVLSNGTHADFFLNAVVALAIERGIAITGRDAGWLNEKCTLMVQGPKGAEEWHPS